LVETALVLIGDDEAGLVLGGNRKRSPGRQFLVDHETVGELLAGIVWALRAVGKSPFDDARPDGARFVDEAGGLGYTSIADNLFGGDAKAEVLMPTVAEFLPTGRVDFNAGPICKA